MFLSMPSSTTPTAAGRLVAITGGARGIGRATAATLVARGAAVAIGDVDLDLARETAARLGPSAVALPLDVTDPDAFAAFLDEAEQRLGPLYALVNNAGIMPISPFCEEEDAAQRRTLDINVHGVITGSRLAIARMLPRGQGHVVNVASQAGKLGAAGLATYCASKFAVVGLCEALRAELHGTGIAVSCILPAVVNTDLTAGVTDAPRILRIEPEDVADAIADTLDRPRAEVFVPRAAAAGYRAGGLLSPRVRDALLRRLGADRVMAAAHGSAARRAYEARAAGDSPTPEARIR